MARILMRNASEQPGIPNGTANPPANPSYSDAAPVRLTERFGIDEENLAWRQKAVHIEESDRSLLIEMTPWAKSVAPQLVKDYFDAMFAIAPLRENYERWASALRSAFQNCAFVWKNFGSAIM